MSLTKKQKALLGKAADTLVALAEKCGGPGGKPGPCPSGGGQKPNAGNLSHEERARVIAEGEARERANKPPKKTEPTASAKITPSTNPNRSKIDTDSGKILFDAVPPGTTLKPYTNSKQSGPIGSNGPVEKTHGYFAMTHKKTRSEEVANKMVGEVESLGKVLMKKDSGWTQIPHKEGVRFKHSDGHVLSATKERSVAPHSFGSTAVPGGGGKLQGVSVAYQIQTASRPESAIST